MIDWYGESMALACSRRHCEAASPSHRLRWHLRKAWRWLVRRFKSPA